MTVWIVQGDDRDFDGGTIWIVGVYNNKELAVKAKARDWIRYWKENGPPCNLDYSIKEYLVQGDCHGQAIYAHL